MPLSEKQLSFLKAFRTRKYRFLLFGGGTRGGKSWTVLNIIHRMCIDYPSTRYFVIRKHLSVIKRSSIPSYMSVLEENNDKDIITFNRSELVAKYDNGSEIYFMEADISKDPDLNKIKGTEFTAGCLEECNEIEHIVFSTLLTRINSCKNKDYDIPGFVLLTCNPSNGWVKDVFYDPWSENTLDPPYYFEQALAKDNPFISDEYLKALEELPENEYNRYVLGNWDYNDDPFLLIPYHHLKNCLIDSPENKSGLIYLGIDASFDGPDKTILAYFRDNELFKFEEIDSKVPRIAASVIKSRMEEYDIDPDRVAIDVLGPGSNIYGALSSMRIEPVQFKASASVERDKLYPMDFLNLRAKCHWDLREDILNSRISIINNKEFIRQATNIYYKMTEKDLRVEPKDKVNQRIGCSPDYFDAAKIANWIRRKPKVSFKEMSRFSTTSTMSSGINY